MNLTLVFSRKYRWPEHHFSVWSLGSSQKLLTRNQFLVSAIFFTIINISFFQSAFWSYFNHSQRSQSNHKQCSLWCSFPCFLVLLGTHYGPLQCFSTYLRKLKEVGVLRPIFPDCYFLWLWFQVFLKWNKRYLLPLTQFHRKPIMPQKLFHFIAEIRVSPS